ncbi:GD22777 [Drosophila simulans]|uniref:GD22777 n=1 Tax=Drosophila simulans TaxID=7240 RepID=B4Q935_DROSI|nr:GD22777 [Drosophila simulans]
MDTASNLTKSIDRGATLTNRGANLTKSVIEPRDFTKVIHQGANLTLSMDQLPLLEHISMPSGLDILSSKCSSNVEKLGQETDDALDVTLTSLAQDRPT